MALCLPRALRASHDVSCAWCSVEVAWAASTASLASESTVRLLSPVGLGPPTSLGTELPSLFWHVTRGGTSFLSLKEDMVVEVRGKERCETEKRLGFRWELVDLVRSLSFTPNVAGDDD